MESRGWSGLVSPGCREERQFGGFLFLVRYCRFSFYGENFVKDSRAGSRKLLVVCGTAFGIASKRECFGWGLLYRVSCGYFGNERRFVTALQAVVEKIKKMGEENRGTGDRLFCPGYAFPNQWRKRLFEYLEFF